MIDGQLIICPECASFGKKQVLGKILTNGDFLVLRFHHGTTIVRAVQLSILCGCGYAHTVTGGVALPETQQNYVETDRSY